MKTKALVVIAVLLAVVIAGFFVLAPKGGQEVAGETLAPATEAPAAEAVSAPAADAAASSASGEVAAPDAVSTGGAISAATPQPDSFAVPPVDLDLPTDDTPTEGRKPADPAPQPQP